MSPRARPVPIPAYEPFMLPLLRCLRDGQVRHRHECNEPLIDYFQLTPEEVEQLLPSGKQTALRNRAGWASTHLAKAGLIERPRRGYMRITERGLEALRVADQGITIDNAYLLQYPEFVEFFRPSSPQGDTPARLPTPLPATESRTPQEAMEAAYQTLRAALAGELLERIMDGSPRFFEQVVLDLLVAMGYGGSRADAAQAVGGSGDGGVDGWIKEDKLGLDSIYLQAKRWEGSVGRPIVQAFAGSLEGHRARKGVLITTSRFSQDAYDYVRSIEKRIVLIDGERLTTLMIDHGVGVADVAVYPVKRIDEDYFEDA
jgi:restriction system protein